MRELSLLRKVNGVQMSYGPDRAAYSKNVVGGKSTSFSSNSRNLTNTFVYIMESDVLVVTQHLQAPTRYISWACVPRSAHQPKIRSIMKWWSKCISMVITKTACRNIASLSGQNKRGSVRGSIGFSLSLWKT